MKVSIIIPCFNESTYLTACLSSLSRQTRAPDEVIICNNNSTDSTVDIAKSFKKKLPIRVINQPIKGIFPTVEKAWRSSTGDIVVRTDADARFPINWLKNIVHHFETDPDLAACGGIWYSWDGKLWAKILTLFAGPLADIYFPLFKGYKMLFGPNTAIRRSVLEKLNGYITDDPSFNEDGLVCYKLTQAKLKYARFADCYNYHSSRSWNNDPKKMLLYFMSAIDDKFYPLKSV